ncbi:glycosyltransferase family 4 protein [Aestuariibaculum lutulentum]|uniref:Glycosyltransferase family 4 protein n=1 Tax=Aestuariibaculum lutulentum TaxID=2920935 RepID=A0ABS9RE90_9FLAO|nr:glycosyltransferase family 4 protein [Aestuariibaculum lutulentum]MCH4551227.1 glycosyltransferase family 4 protein [Aestuariibaculum lutulentum]
MKIAFVTPEYPHQNFGKSGGVGTSIYGLTKALKELGHTVSVLVYGQKKDAYFEEQGIHFYTIKNIKLKGLSLILTQKKVERLINALYDQGRLELVEAPDWTGFTAFVKPKCPVVIRENGSDTYFCHLEQRPVKFKNKFLERRALKRADGIISVSRFTGELTNKVLGLKRPFEVIPNSVNINEFNPNHSDKQPLTILYFGTLIRKKGLFELVEIFNRVHEKNKEVKLVLVGHDSGDIKTGKTSTWSLMQPVFTASAIKQVQYLGGVNHQMIQEVINAATVCVFPSFAEAFPLSWLEAMAMEKPIVASNIGWAKEMINDDKEGFLVHPKAHDNYAHRILELLNNQQKREDFGKAARKRVIKDFSHMEIAGKSVEFYKPFIK